MLSCFLRAESIWLAAIILNLTNQLEMLLLAFEAADWMLGLLAVKISFVSTNHAPAKLATLNSMFVLNVDKRQRFNLLFIIFILFGSFWNRIKRNLF